MTVAVTAPLVAMLWCLGALTMERINTEHSSHLVWKHCETLYYRFDHSNSVKRTDNHDFSTPLETLTSRLKLPN